ncbi:lgc-39 (predicted) [Pycnogonum litorale]
MFRSSFHIMFSFELLICVNGISLFDDTGCSASRLGDDVELQLGGYKKWENGMNGKATVVHHTMYISSISNVDKFSMTMKIQMWHNMEWYDPRLPLLQSEEELILSEEYMDLLFIPFQFYIQTESVSSLKRSRVLTLNHNRTMSLGAMSNVALVCPMNFDVYPFDLQRCKLEMINVKAKVHVAVNVWKTLIIDPNVRSKLHEYDILILRMEPNELTVEKKIYSRIGIRFRLKRNIAGHMFSTFLPSGIFTLLSWLTMYIPPHLVQPRVTLAITTLLTIVTLSVDARNDLPTMGKMRAIDLWFLVCFGTSVAALVETVVVVTYCVKYRIERVDESLENDKVLKLIYFT